MRCPPGPIQGSRQAHSPKALDNAPEAYGREPEEAETEPESEDRAVEDAQPAKNTLPDGRMECEFCGRKFNPASYERHQPICQKVFGGSRPQFLASQASKGAGDRARAANRGGTSIGQSSQNGHSPRSLGKAAQRSQPGHGSPRGEHSSKITTASQRTSEAPAAVQSPAHELRVAGQDSQELEQRVMRVMSDQMEELRNLRQQVREEPESSVLHGKTGSARLENGTKVESHSAAVKAADAAGTCAPRPQERARRAPKSPTNPEERLLPQPKKVAGEDRSLAKGQGSLVSAAEMQLIPCEDCGRRFNPASLEKHRAVCRNVFGKTRTTFESQNQRLRGVKAQEPAKEPASESKEDASTAAPRRRHRAVLEAKVEVHPPATALASGPTPSSSSCRAEAPAHERASRGDRGGTSPRRPAREPDLQPCPHCGRSFRPAVVDKHVKVCQSVFPSHDVKRTQNGREHRNGKGSAQEAPSESRGSKVTNITPARGRPKAADQVKPKEVEPEVLEATPVVFGGEEGGDPGSPIWSLAFEAPQAQAAEKAAQDGLDVWEQEVEEAIQAMSEPMQDVSPLTMDTPASASCGALQERATLLERARLGMKMGQRPQQALFGSTSEVALTAERYRAFLPTPAESSATTPADRIAQQSAAPRFFEAHGASNAEASQRRGPSDFLSRSQPVVPTLTEAPLSSRSSNRPWTMEGSPLRRLSYQSLGQAEGVGPSRPSGLRLPVQRREPQPGPQVEIRTAPKSHVAAKVKPGLGREDPAPAKISLSQSFTLSASGASSPLQSRSGSMQLPVRSQRTPREQPQAFAVPAAPPPSPSVPARQQAPITFETVSPPANVVSPVVAGGSPWEVSTMPVQRGYVSNLSCTTSSPLLRVRSVEPPRTAFMMQPQRTVPRLDLAKLRRP